MKILKFFLVFFLLTTFFAIPAFAKEGDPERADEWFIKERLKSPAPKNKKSLKDYIKEGEERTKGAEKSTNIGNAKNNSSKEISRYLMLFKDDDYIYWLDTEALRWREMPYSITEDMLDCWVKIEDISEDKEYTYPEKYYMEHLYLRPAKRQVMFLSELEVTGRPDNNINERKYKPDYWEELVPGSVEEEIYKGTLAVLEVLEKNHRVKRSEKTKSYNFFEDIIGIGGWF